MDVAKQAQLIALNVRDDKNKLESQIRHTGDSSTINMTELGNKLLFIEEKMQIEEQERNELRQKLAAQEETNRALNGILKSFKVQGDTELG